MTDRAQVQSTVLNVVLYQSGWFACVLGAAGGWATGGAGVAFALTLAHVALAERPRAEWPLVAVALLLGAGVDTLQTALGVLDLPDHAPGDLAPPWILALWAQFATLLHFGLAWLSGRYLLASVLGLVGGPLAFWGGARLGAATLGEPLWLSLAALGIAWALAMPALVALADRWRGSGRYRIFGRPLE